MIAPSLASSRGPSRRLLYRSPQVLVNISSPSWVSVEVNIHRNLEEIESSASGCPFGSYLARHPTESACSAFLTRIDEKRPNC